MTSRKKIRAQLRAQLGSNELVEVRRRTEVGDITGFVVGLGAKWVMLALVTDGGFFDGHIALKLGEIRSVRLDGSFQTSFAQTRPEWPPALPERAVPIDLDNTRGLLRTFALAEQLVGIEADYKFRAKWIGVPDEIIGPWVYLREIDTHAVWRDKPRGFRIRRIVVVTIGDNYQRALAAMADGPAPRDPLVPEWSPRPASRD